MDYYAIQKAVVEVVKEALRWALLAAVSAFIAYIVDNLTAIPIPIEFIPYLTAFLRGVDKFVHNYGKELGNDTATKGITRF